MHGAKAAGPASRETARQYLRRQIEAGVGSVSWLRVKIQEKFRVPRAQSLAMVEHEMKRDAASKDAAEGLASFANGPPPEYDHPDDDPLKDMRGSGAPKRMTRAGSAAAAAAAVGGGGGGGGGKKAKYELLPAGPLPRIELGPDEHAMVEPTWGRDGEPKREIVYNTGGPGAGKSTFNYMYAGRWRALHPDGTILLVTALKEDDPSLPCGVPPTNIKRMKLETLLDNPLKPETELKDMLLIVDDIENITPKALEVAVRQMVNEVATRGRHWRTSMIMSSHVPADYNKTKHVLLSADVLVWFPKYTASANITYMLTKYGNLSTDEAAVAARQRSRWIALRKAGKIVIADGVVYAAAHGDGGMPPKASR